MWKLYPCQGVKMVILTSLLVWWYNVMCVICYSFTEDTRLYILVKVTNNLALLLLDNTPEACLWWIFWRTLQKLVYDGSLFNAVREFIFWCIKIMKCGISIIMFMLFISSINVTSLIEHLAFFTTTSTIQRKRGWERHQIKVIERWEPAYHGLGQYYSYRGVFEAYHYVAVLDICGGTVTSITIHIWEIGNNYQLPVGVGSCVKTLLTCGWKWFEDSHPLWEGKFFK